MNPFNFDKIAQNDAFCGRQQELTKLNQIVLSKNNLVIYGERRYGKSSLIKKAFSDFPDTVLPVYVDIYRAVDQYDIALAIYHAVIDAIPFSLEEKIKQIPKLFTRLNVSMSPSRSGDSISFKPHIENKTFNDIIEDTLNAISIVCKNKSLTHAVIAIDEFQQVSKINNIKIDAVLREISQNHPHVCFIFSGSKKNMLRKLLNHKQAPWYGMTTPLILKGIEEPAFFDFCRNKLNAKLDRAVFSYLLEVTRAQTRLVLQVCSRLYADSLTIITPLDIDRVLLDIIDDYDDEYRHFYMNLPARQRNAIMAIGLSNGSNIYSQSILTELRINKQTLLKALDALEEAEEIVKLGEGCYQFYELMLGLWVEHKLMLD